MSNKAKVLKRVSADFTCAVCAKKLSTKGNLKAHMELKHNRNHEPIKCPLCESEYNEKRNLKTHLRKHHFGGLEKTKVNSKMSKEIDRILKKGTFCRF